jgi:hypothetical protein
MFIDAKCKLSKWLFVGCHRIFNFRISDDFLLNESVVLSKGGFQYRYPDTFSVESTSFYRYNWCFGANGYIIIHNPQDPPLSKKYMKTETFYEAGKLQQFVITPKITTTSSSLRKITAKE